jgi:hypothetical protein
MAEGKKNKIIAFFETENYRAGLWAYCRGKGWTLKTFLKRAADYYMRQFPADKMD